MYITCEIVDKIRFHILLNVEYRVNNVHVLVSVINVYTMTVVCSRANCKIMNQTRDVAHYIAVMSQLCMFSEINNA